MEIKRSPGVIITGIGIGLALLAAFGSNLPFAPSNMFLPFMLILVGRAVSRGAKAGNPRKQQTTIFRMPPTVPPSPAPTQKRPRSVPAPAPIEVIAPEPTPVATEPEASDLEERLRSVRAAAETKAASLPKPVSHTPMPKPSVPTFQPAHPRAPAYPTPTPSSAKAKSSKEMVEEAKKRIQRG